MSTAKDLEDKIAEIKAALDDVHGTETEVYARIVGYYRSVRNWNKGKKEEFTNRKMFTGKPSNGDVVGSFDSDTSTEQDRCTFIEVFTRKTCPNCPPVANYCRTLGAQVHFIDTDTPEGIERAVECGVNSCPTAILYADTETEIARAYSVPELKRSIRIAAEAIA